LLSEHEVCDEMLMRRTSLLQRKVRGQRRGWNQHDCSCRAAPATGKPDQRQGQGSLRAVGRGRQGLWRGGMQSECEALPDQRPAVDVDAALCGLLVGALARVGECVQAAVPGSCTHSPGAEPACACQGKVTSSHAGGSQAGSSSTAAAGKREAVHGRLECRSLISRRPGVG
jgi:hypothetical protein